MYFTSNNFLRFSRTRPKSHCFNLTEENCVKIMICAFIHQISYESYSIAFSFRKISKKREIRSTILICDRLNNTFITKTKYRLLLQF